MDNKLLIKIKSQLVNCTPENVDTIKSKLMVIIKPNEADKVYDYFITQEPDYIKDNCKVNIYQVIPQYGDYFVDNNSTADIFMDEDGDLD
jgi:hypothetical protein